MKRFLLFLLPSLLLGAPGDIKISYKASNNITWIDAIFPKVVDSLLGLNANGVPITVSAGSNITIAGGVISASGGGGGGSVSSVAMTVPTGFTVAGSPITNSGTLAVTFTGGQTANLFLATPNGLTGALSLRAIVAADVPNAVADGATKGVAAFTAADFNATAGVISIDYTNGQAASSGAKGFLTAADWTTFNAKQAAGTYVTAVSIASANGVSGSSSGGATPALTIVLGAITPTSLTTTGSISTGIGGSTAGALELGQGTAPSAGTTSIKFYAPASVTSYIRTFPGAAGTGFYLGTNSAGTVTDTQVLSNGSGNVLLASGTIAITSGKTVTFDHTSTFTTTDSAVYTFPGSTKTLLATDGSGASLTAITAANISAGALADGMTATTQSPATNTTRIASGAYADASSAAAAKAGMVGTYATPDTTGGAVTLTQAVTEVWTNTTTTYTIPPVASSTGKAIIFYVVGTNLITIDPNASDIIVRDGTGQTGGVTITLTGTAGNYVCMICDGTRWVTLGFKGTLAAGS